MKIDNKILASFTLISPQHTYLSVCCRGRRPCQTELWPREREWPHYDPLLISTILWLFLYIHAHTAWLYPFIFSLLSIPLVATDAIQTACTTFPPSTTHTHTPPSNASQQWHYVNPIRIYTFASSCLLFFLFLLRVGRFFLCNEHF